MDPVRDDDAGVPVNAVRRVLLISPMDVSHIIDGLNDAQRAAVTAPLGSALVLAGAGSGKTRCWSTASPG